MGVGDYLKQPDLMIPAVLDSMTGLWELMDQIGLRNNPNLRNLRNIDISGANQLLGEARSGGGISTPFSGLNEYARGQIGNTQNSANPFSASLGTIGSGKPGQFKMPEPADFGDTSMFDNPYRTLFERGATGPGAGTIEDFKPQGRGFLERAGDFLGNILPKFEDGTTSVPRTGPAIVHQGEMIIPKNMNPMAQGPSQPMNTMAMRMPEIPPPAQPAQAPPPAPMPAMQQGGSPPMLGTGVSMAPNNRLPAAGLNPQTQQLLMQRQQQTTGNQLMSQERRMREDAATMGNIGGGDLANQMFQARLAADTSNNNFGRDLAIEAENRRFSDGMAQAEFGLNQQMGLGGLDLQRQGLNLERELGQGRLALDRNTAGQQFQLGQGQLGLGQDRLGLDRFATERELGLADRRLGLEEQLGRGGLDLQRQGLDLDRELGRGQLGLGRDSLGLERELGRGGLDLQRDNLNLERELGRGGLDLQRDLGTRNANVQQQLANQNYDLANRDMNFQQGTAFDESRRQFDEDARIRELIASGQISLGNRGYDLQERGMQTDTEFGQFDREYRNYWDNLNRQDSLAALLAQTNSGNEGFINDYLGRLFGQSGLPTPAGA